ncbi:MAG: 50S ribosomal protein L24 [Campylobacter sp.]|nr:50S ribosomal protein L24 [Campylobacter sp.]
MANIKLKIKKGDTVKVITGDDKGKTGIVKAVFPKDRKIIVDGVNVVKKAVKPSEKYQNGGFIGQEMRIDVSNVAKVEE